jgi:hypothetical protein
VHPKNPYFIRRVSMYLTRANSLNLARFATIVSMMFSAAGYACENVLLLTAVSR